MYVCHGNTLNRSISSQRISLYTKPGLAQPVRGILNVPYWAQILLLEPLILDHSALVSLLL